MPNVTVLAPDSALAMDEVVRQLGDNAYIIATHTRDGQVEILATNEPGQIQLPRKRVTSVSFVDAISEQLQQATGTGLSFKSTRNPASSLGLAEAMPELLVQSDVWPSAAAQDRSAPEMFDDTAPEPEPEPEPPQSAIIVTIPQLANRSIEAPAVVDTHEDAIETTATTVAATLNETSADTSADFTTLPPAQTGEGAIVAQLHPNLVSIDAPPPPPPPPQPVSETPRSEPEHSAADLRPMLTQLTAQLARLEATMTLQVQHVVSPRDPFEIVGFSADVVQRFAPDRMAMDRVAHFVTAMTKTLIPTDPLASLSAPVVVIVGPSGGGKTTLAGKIAALMRETQTTGEIELIALSQTLSFANTPLSTYARMLSMRHQSWEIDQFEASQFLTPTSTRIFDTTIDPQALREKIGELRAQIGHASVAVVVALPVGISHVRARTELAKYSDLDPIIALTKLDECELSPEEASIIAETGTQIAWLSGTCALNGTMAPATNEMMTEFLTGLLADRT